MKVKNWNITDNDKRWIVVGVALNTALLPKLKEMIELEMVKLYKKWNQAYRIESQTTKLHLRKDQSFTLNYQSINSNHSLGNKSKWNHDIRDPNELAKLYLKPHMVKFSKLSDESFDIYAALSMICFSSAFNTDLQDAARNVKDDVRNP